MCGKDGVKLVKARIEGTVMAVCKDCAKFGTVLGSPDRHPEEAAKAEGPSPKGSGTRATGGPGRKATRRDVLDRVGEKTLKEDYGKLIRRAREEREWSQEDLGKKLAEKVSVIKELETQKMTPPDELVRKLERTLDIELMEAVEPVEMTKSSSGQRGMTLGDMIKREGEK